MQEDHYQPEDSDTCFPCECYSIGSFRRTCDPLTGQCPCRSGVIGRRCDACSSQFAEVTLRGCEGTCGIIVLLQQAILQESPLK